MSKFKLVSAGTRYITRYYVDSSEGSDGNDGLSPETPWETITKINAADLLPGDRVLFKCGQTFSGRLAPTKSGTYNKPIVYGSYGSGARPVIDGSSAKAFSVLSGAAHHFRVEHLDFSGSTNANQHVVKSDTHDQYWYDCIFRNGAGGTQGNGMGFSAYVAGTEGSGALLYNITLDSCVFHDNAASGATIGSSLGTAGPNASNCIYKNCIAYNNGTTDYLDHGLYARHGVTFDGCICYNNIHGGGIKVNCENITDSPYTPIIKNCTSYGNKEGLVLDNVNSLVYNNVFYTNATYGMSIGQGDGSTLYFNTFANETSGGNGLITLTQADVQEMTFKNNIFVQDTAVYNVEIFRITTSTAANFGADNTLDYNIYYHSSDINHGVIYEGSSRGWAWWQTAVGESHGTFLTALPAFTTRYTDFHPANGGNLKGVGVAITGYEIDADGNTRQVPITPGCYDH